MRHLLVFFFCSSLAFLIPRTAKPQLTTADVLGTVTDPSGGVLPNAQVVLTNNDTHEVRTTTSNASGEYTFTLLQSGHYGLTATASGFRKFVIEDFTLNAGDRLRQDVRM